MAAVRRATVSWNGDLATGSGRLGAATSGAFSDLPVTWASRTESADGRTSPEELLAAAHASCYAMAFSGELTKAGWPPEHLDVSSEIDFERLDGKWTVVSSKLTVRGRVPGIDEARFRAIAEGAKDGCPISRAMKGNVAVSVGASLER
ncbi:MAG: OsmC family peroxiredoxin [Candidatus Limnocylindrales bacterium]|jgi:osmotically inducible protein OsmC